MDKDKNLIFRYDNAGHHPEIATFPHHKHTPNGIEESNEPNMEDIMKEVIGIITSVQISLGNKTSENDQYEYIKEIGNANLVLYEMRGIDNGILVIYKFMFNNQKWMLEEMEDASN